MSLRQVNLVTDAKQDTGKRLDQFLVEALQEEEEPFSRTRIQKLIDDGLVKVAGVSSKAGHKLRPGEPITVEIPDTQTLQLLPEDISLSVVYEDKHLLVIDKPAGMVVHPGAGVISGTLVNALLHHCRGSLSGISGVARPGIVHRLDKDTSGLLMVAKTDQAHLDLSQQIASRNARRHYLALLEGRLPADIGTVDQPIGRHPVDRKRMCILPEGRPAVTHFQVLTHWTRFALIEARLQTGRTHQIRVHMNSLNCPVVGDLLYNKRSSGSESARKRLGLEGQALHAAYLSFTHPITRQVLEFESPLPGYFQRLLDSLHNE